MQEKRNRAVVKTLYALLRSNVLDCFMDVWKSNSARLSGYATGNSANLFFPQIPAIYWTFIYYVGLAQKSAGSLKRFRKPREWKGQIGSSRFLTMLSLVISFQVSVWGLS